MHQNRSTYPERKTRMHQQLQATRGRYKVLALVKMDKVRSPQILPLRKRMKGEAELVSIKNRIARKALEGAGTGGIRQFVDNLTGQCMLVLTDMSPFKLNMLLTKSRIMLAARAGDTASVDVVVKKQNTGIAPGPMLTEFKDAKIPTKIDQGTIWITKDTIPAKKGDVISEQLAPLLTKLNIKPVEAGIALEYALEDDMLYDRSDLTIDVDAVRSELALCQQMALNLAVEAAYVTPESVAAVLAKASHVARSLSVESGHMTDETKGEVLQRAHLRGRALAGSAKGYAPA